jgi:twitching motility two-component system response regulator PilH
VARILIVEDSPTQRVTMARTVEQQGHEVILLEEGNNVMATVLEERPDLIVMDVMLPDRSGFAITAELSQSPSTAAIPIVLVSVKDQDVDREYGLRQGARAYLAKPFSDSQLIAVLDGLLVG